MKKRQKKTIKVQAFIFSLLLLVVLSYGVPIKLEASNDAVTLTSSQVEGRTKKEYEKDYKTKVKKAKSDYRKARSSANKELSASLQAAKNKGDRIEARKEYRERLKSADTKLSAETKNAKETYRKQISE
jgi:hypothetical protein